MKNILCNRSAELVKSYLNNHHTTFLILSKDSDTIPAGKCNRVRTPQISSQMGRLALMKNSPRNQRTISATCYSKSTLNQDVAVTNCCINQKKRIDPFFTLNGERQAILFSGRFSCQRFREYLLVYRQIKNMKLNRHSNPLQYQITLLKDPKKPTDTPPLEWTIPHKEERHFCIAHTIKHR